MTTTLWIAAIPGWMILNFTVAVSVYNWNPFRAQPLDRADLSWAWPVTLPALGVWLLVYRYLDRRAERKRIPEARVVK